VQRAPTHDAIICYNTFMVFNPEIHHRRSIRLKGFDYSCPGDYFITVCVIKKELFFGKIVDHQMILNEIGELVKQEWLNTQKIRENIVCDEFVVMPNHIHGILRLNYDCRGTLPRAHSIEKFGKPLSNSVPTIIRLFKSTSTKQINSLRGIPGTIIWQRNYYEHVIRNEVELMQIRKYVKSNPLHWQEDEESLMAPVLSFDIFPSDNIR
jgi:putative transposase